MTNDDIDFDTWFDTLKIHVLDETGVEFQDEDSVKAEFDSGMDVFDVIDSIADEYGRKPKGPRKLISSDEAVEGKVQHKKACSDCPWRRDSLNGWLGGHTIEEFLDYAHTNTRYDCHAIKHQQCAGMAIYRANVFKRVEPPLLKLDRDHEKVFSTPMEFRSHHEAGPGGLAKKAE